MMKKIAQWLQTLPTDQRFIDLTKWQQYVLVRNTKNTRSAEFKRLFQPYANRISERFLKDAIQKDQYEFQIDKMEKITEGVFKGQKLELYQMYVIVLILVVNKDLLPCLTIADLVMRITRFIVRSPTYVQRLLIDFKDWFRPQDYGIMEIVVSNEVASTNQVSKPEQSKEKQAFDRITSSIYQGLIKNYHTLIIAPETASFSRLQASQRRLFEIKNEKKEAKKEFAQNMSYKMKLKQKITAIMNMKS